jgi:hypothetical protein
LTALATSEAAANAAEAAGARGAVDALLDELRGEDSGVERVHGSETRPETAAPHREVAPT